MSKHYTSGHECGVDSSTAAVLLRDRGYQVVGCTMQLWDHRRNPGQQSGRCCSLDDVYDARRIAQRLGFPFYVLNLQKPFEKQVNPSLHPGVLGGANSGAVHPVQHFLEV